MHLKKKNLATLPDEVKPNTVYFADLNRTNQKILYCGLAHSTFTL